MPWTQPPNRTKRAEELLSALCASFRFLPSSSFMRCWRSIVLQRFCSRFLFHFFLSTSHSFVYNLHQAHETLFEVSSGINPKQRFLRRLHHCPFDWSDTFLNVEGFHGVHHNSMILSRVKRSISLASKGNFLSKALHNFLAVLECNIHLEISFSSQLICISLNTSRGNELFPLLSISWYSLSNRPTCGTHRLQILPALWV